MEDKVLLGHGSGGTMMRRIIDEVFFEAYAGDELRRGDDAAVLPELISSLVATSDTSRYAER